MAKSAEKKNIDIDPADLQAMFKILEKTGYTLKICGHEEIELSFAMPVQMIKVLCDKDLVKKHGTKETARITKLLCVAGEKLTAKEDISCMELEVPGK